MTHCAHRLRVRAGHLTATGPVTPTCSHDRWGRAEAARTALGEALDWRRRTRVRFPPPPPRGAGEKPATLVGEKAGGHCRQQWPPALRLSGSVQSSSRWSEGLLWTAQLLTASALGRLPLPGPCLGARVP